MDASFKWRHEVCGGVVDETVTVDVVAAVIAAARQSGLTVGDVVTLRSTNNIVLWLSPSDVVAKIAPDADRGLGEELAWARRLTALGAPIVRPAGVLGASVHRIGERDVTFWRYTPQHDETPPSSDAIAIALLELHRALRRCEAPEREVSDGLNLTIELLSDETFAVGVPIEDRRLLQAALRSLVELASAGAGVVHGSPHRSNILAADGEVRFIDFETVARGPIEWDLAHLEPAVAATYAGAVDHELVARCRIGVSAFTAAHCWHGRHRGPDMIAHARHHLDVVRRAERGRASE